MRRILPHLPTLGVLLMVGSLVGSPTHQEAPVRAQLQARRYTTLSAELGAKVAVLPFAEGDRFAAGDLLAALDDALPRAQLQRAEAELQAARAALSSNQALEKLSSVGKVELEQSRAGVARAEAEVSAAQSLLAKCRMTAPFAGRIAEQKVRELQYVQPGQALLDILDDRVLELELIVPSRWLSWLREGTAFSVTIDETGRAYPAKVSRAGARVDPVSQTLKVTAAIDGHYPELLAGMSGEVSLSQH